MTDVPNTFRLGDWQVDSDLCELYGSSGEKLALQPKIMDVLICLVHAGGRVVSRQELIEKVWQGRPTSDEPINRCIAELRSALGDDRNNPRYIRTVPKRGYQLLVEVMPADGTLPRQRRSRWWVYAMLGVSILAAWWLWLPNREFHMVDRPRILVLPLAPVSEDSELLANALTEEILNALAQSPELLVFSRATTFSVADKADTPMETARKLQADLVLEGSLRLTSERLRMTVQLVDVETEIHVFSRDFELGKEQADTLIPDLSRMIASAIGQTLPQNDYHAQLQHLDFAAYRDFVEAAFLHRQRGRDNFESALQRLRKVVERYPEFAPAHARLAGVYNSYYWFVEALPEYRELSSAHLQQALALNPAEPYALALRAMGRPHADVIRTYRQVLQADAGLTSVRYGLGIRLARAGYLAEGAKELGWLHKREPLQASYAFRQALPLLALEEFDAFSERRKRLRELEKESLAGWLSLLVAMTRNDMAAAVEAWPAISIYEAEATGLVADDIAVLLQAALSRNSCDLLADSQSVDLAQLPDYWQFFFLAAAPACADKALAMRFKQTAALPEFDIPYLLWLPQTAHLRAHPQFSEFVEQFDFPQVWKELGPPDMCEARDGNVICH